jgi:hypothetical protein
MIYRALIVANGGIRNSFGLIKYLSVSWNFSQTQRMSAFCRIARDAIREVKVQANKFDSHVLPSCSWHSTELESSGDPVWV